MNIGPDQADRLDLKTFEGLLHHWNRMHATDAPETAHDMGRLRILMEAHSVH